jgi:glyoxylase-like metal-dependent hydrolase (beta-lactamase superfamily II)
MRRAVALCSLCVLCVLCVSVEAQQSPAKAVTQQQFFVEAYFLRNEVYFLSNGRTNAVAIVTADGVVLLDGMSAGWGARVRDAVQKVSYMPVTAIINSHAHEDHAGADAEYPDAVQIVMHENSRKRLARSSAKDKGIKTFADGLPVTIGNRPLHVYYFGRGHTDGDAIVVIPDIKAAYVGDLFTEKALPVIDPAAGGSALALPGTLARASREITGVDRIVTGHGRWPGSKADPGGIQRWPAWSDFQEYAEFTREFVEAVTAGWKSGKSAEQTSAALRMPEKYKDYRLDGAKALIETIFKELKQSPAAKP